MKTKKLNLKEVVKNLQTIASYEMIFNYKFEKNIAYDIKASIKSFKIYMELGRTEFYFSIFPYGIMISDDFESMANFNGELEENDIYPDVVIKIERDSKESEFYTMTINRR